MARKAIKQEHVSMMHETFTDPSDPRSSGDTIVIDSDSTMTDEGYETNHHAKKPVLSADIATGIRNGPAEVPAIGPSHDHQGGLQLLGRGVKKMVRIVQELRHLGLEDLDLPLPKIVVVGDQSTGKSSLIEGISEIKVPRSAGTCTRCPMELNISESSSPWSCRISLHKKFTYTAAKSEAATRARPLGPWMSQDTEDFLFAVLSDKEDVAHTIYLAQLATLNPGQPYEKYLPGVLNLKEEHQVKFSPNVVRLDISGPSLPNLSFYDLPGVINVSELAEEAYLVNLVRNLVKAYIKADDCINLLALPMTDDPANSSASKLVRELKAEARTLGCLTKPDRLQHVESYQQWAQVLSGERFRLGYGYHVVMNNPEVGVSHSVARREEEAFFSGKEPWATTLRQHASHFGTFQLQNVLSQRLTAQIRQSLPRISEQVQQKAEEIRTMLKELPEPLNGNLAVGVMGELMKFQQQLKEIIDGGQKTNPFHKEWNMTADKLRQDLADTRPVLLFSSLRTPQHNHGSHASHGMYSTPTPIARNVAPIAIDSDDPDEVDTPTKASPIVQGIGQKRPCASLQSSQKKPKRTKDEFPTASVIKESASKRFTLSKVQEILQDAYSGLNHLVDPKAIESMITLSMEHWGEPLERFLLGTRTLCEEMVFQQVQTVYGKYAETQYYETIRKICEVFFEKAFIEQRELLHRVLKWELSRPKTCNDKAISQAQAEALTLLQTKRREIRAGVFLDEQEARIGKQSVGQVRIEKLAKITEDQLGPDPFKKEIEAMTTVKAYYDCAHYRFVDVVCASIYCELFTKCRDNITNEIKSVLNLTEADVEQRLAILLAANPAQQQRRVQLEREMDTINKSQERLEGSMDDDSSDCSY